MNDLNKQAIEAPINAQGIEEFNRQTDSSLVLIREFCEDLFLHKNNQSIAVCLAAALVAAEVAATSGGTSGRSLNEVRELLDSLHRDMRNHAERVFESFRHAEAATQPEDVAFREVAANDA